MEIVQKYFSDFTNTQMQQLQQLQELYAEWNTAINVISRKDIESLYEKHVLHSLAISTVFDFKPGTKIVDIGTGGGFPGIPLAILFPEVEFVLADSIAKKLKVVNGVATAIGLKNVTTAWSRVEDIPNKLYFDFAVSRAVAPLKDLWQYTKHLVKKTGINDEPNGLICLKGGDLHQEISESDCNPKVWQLSEMFEEDFFSTKYMLYIQR